MDEFKLSEDFKRQVVFDAMYATSNRNMSIDDWRKESMFYWGETPFPSVMRYVGCVAELLSSHGVMADPRFSNDLLLQIKHDTDRLMYMKYRSVV
jgi:hypothetical protein